MPTTSNFGWTTPADTDLVKDGAAAIRTLGNGIDTSLVDLKGGTTGQVLSKNSNTDLDYTWVTPNVGDITEVQAGVGISVSSGTGPIPVITNSSTDLITTAGDILYGTAADTVARLGIGTAGQVLKVNSGATAPEWGAAASAGSFTKISATTFSSVATQNIDSVFTSSYNTYLVAISAFSAATSTDDVRMRLRYSTSTESGGSYYGCRTNMPYSGTLATTGYNGTTYMELAVNSGAAGQGSSGWFYVNMVGGSSTNVAISGQFWEGNAAAGNVFLFDVGGAARTYTGFQLFSSSSNISGTVVVYGLEE